MTRMHKVVAAQLATFAKEFELAEEDEPKRFEHFVNYCVVRRFFPARFDVEDVTTGKAECGIDGAAFLINDELVTTSEEAERILSQVRRQAEVQLILTQAKTGEGFDRGDMLKFGSAAHDLFQDSPALPQDEILKNFRDVYDMTVKHIGKIRGGRPDCQLFFATTGTWRSERELVATIDSVKNSLVALGFFRNIEFETLGREELIRLWTSTREAIEATFEVSKYLPIPPIKGVNEAYVAVVSAKELVAKVLSDADGRIRSSVFEQNVRAFLGEENPVNAQIKETLSDADQHDRFALLNNGITIVSPNVRVQSDNIYVQDFQIVNGCQTSHVLFNSRDRLSDRVMITAKVIEAQDPEVVSRIVAATNSQSQIEKTQFLSLNPKIRQLEQFFKAFADEQEGEKRLYLERRERQYASEGIPEIRIFDIRFLGRAFAAMFLDRPDLAAGYPTQIFSAVDDLYNADYRELPYYTAAYASYRMALLFSNRRLPGEWAKSFKWHLLMVLKYQIAGSGMPALNSKKILPYCQKILDAISAGSKQAEPHFQAAVELVEKVGRVSRDRLKGRPYVNQLKASLGVASHAPS